MPERILKKNLFEHMKLQQPYRTVWVHRLVNVQGCQNIKLDIISVIVMMMCHHYFVITKTVKAFPNQKAWRGVDSIHSQKWCYVTRKLRRWVWSRCVCGRERGGEGSGEQRQVSDWQSWHLVSNHCLPLNAVACWTSDGRCRGDAQESKLRSCSAMILSK